MRDLSSTAHGHLTELGHGEAGHPKDDDDDDSDDDRSSRGTGVRRPTNDGTRSNITAVSRDRDLSRSDKTRDWTFGGPGGQTRDLSAGQTNDRSRNDSRR